MDALHAMKTNKGKRTRLGEVVCNGYCGSAISNISPILLPNRLA